MNKLKNTYISSVVIIIIIIIITIIIIIVPSAEKISHFKI